MPSCCTSATSSLSGLPSGGALRFGFSAIGASFDVVEVDGDRVGGCFSSIIGHGDFKRIRTHILKIEHPIRCESPRVGIDREDTVANPARDLVSNCRTSGSLAITIPKDVVPSSSSSTEKVCGPIDGGVFGGR